MANSAAPLTDLFKELEVAMLEHAEAEGIERAAQTKMTSARNRVNMAQRNLDAALRKLREAAPWDTDWHGKKGESVSV